MNLLQLYLDRRLVPPLVSSALFLLGGMLSSTQGQSYAPPEGGWAYTFAGDVAFNGDLAGDPAGYFKSLDGTWDHDNGSDQWDGSTIGESAPGVLDGLPGGINALGENSTSFIRVQDPGL